MKQKQIQNKQTKKRIKQNSKNLFMYVLKQMGSFRFILRMCNGISVN